MKKYIEFILEVRGSRASEKAKQLNLISDQHGMWLDRSGRPVAKTENGDLVFIKKKSPTSEKTTPEKSIYKKPERNQAKIKPRTPLDSKPSPPKEQPPAPEVENLLNLTVVFGRFNPPTIGHEKLLMKAKEVSGGAELKIYPSRMYGDPNNPLDPSTKVHYMRKSFPKFEENIINDGDMKTIFDVLKSAEQNGYDKVNLVTGSKRRAEYERLAARYNGELYNIAEIKVVPSDSEDPDLENSPNPTSSAKLRKAAAEDNFFDFQKGLSKKLDPKEQQNLFFAVQNALLGGDKSKNESWNLSPSVYYDVIKEDYHEGKIFNVNDIVENMHTGISGKIIRRGPNYVICVNEEYNIMFKSWIFDIREWTDISGVPAEQREVGTDSLLRYTMKMTNTNIINNFLKKRKELNTSKVRNKK